MLERCPDGFCVIPKYYSDFACKGLKFYGIMRTVGKDFNFQSLPLLKKDPFQPEPEEGLWREWGLY